MLYMKSLCCCVYVPALPQYHSLVSVSSWFSKGRDPSASILGPPWHCQHAAEQGEPLGERQPGDGTQDTRKPPLSVNLHFHNHFGNTPYRSCSCKPPQRSVGQTCLLVALVCTKYIKLPDKLLFDGMQVRHFFPRPPLLCWYHVEKQIERWLKWKMTVGVLQLSINWWSIVITHRSRAWNVYPRNCFGIAQHVHVNIWNTIGFIGLFNYYILQLRSQSAPCAFDKASYFKLACISVKWERVKLINWGLQRWCISTVIAFIAITHRRGWLVGRRLTPQLAPAWRSRLLGGSSYLCSHTDLWFWSTINGPKYWMNGLCASLSFDLSAGGTDGGQTDSSHYDRCWRTFKDITQTLSSGGHCCST